MLYKRNQDFPGAEGASFFLWGARQTGKSTLLKTLFPDALWFDLLKNDEFERLQRIPAYLRETVLADDTGKPIVIDEVQRLPELLNDVHWLMTNQNRRFVLCGSSARKILRKNVNLLGGRAMRYELYPMIFHEIDDFDLVRALNHGLLPRHYLADYPQKLIAAYVGNYLQDEIMQEAKLRKISAFSRFLEAAAFSNGEVVHYSNIARDTSVSVPTIKEYFHILSETLVGRFLPAYQKKHKRRLVHAPKFYFFDIGIANHLLKRKAIEPGSELFGKAFEHFIYHELYAHSHYSGLEYPITYWRTASKTEVDFVLGDNEVAMEVKGAENVGAHHLKGLNRFREEYTAKRLLLVSTDNRPRRTGSIEILPWKVFLQKLWAGEIIG